MDPEPDKKGLFDSTLRRIYHEDASSQPILKVFCSRIGQAIDVRDCRSCDHGLGLHVDHSDGETVLRCAWQGTSVERAPAALDEAAPLEIEAEHLNARQTRLSAIMTSPARSVTQDTSIGALVRLFFAEGISAAPVVDSDGRAIGIVSKTDVVRRCFEDDAARDALAGACDTRKGLAPESGFEIDNEEIAAISAREIMTHIVYTLTAEASISRAAALMAYEGVHRIVIAAADGTALGIVSALDILRWMARQDGYIVPGVGRIQTDQRSKRPG